MLNLHCHELMGKIEEHEGKNVWWLMIICYLNYETRSVNIVGIEKFKDTKILINTDNKLSDNITLKKCCDINYMRYKK